MFGYSIVQLARRNGHKMDKQVRQQLVGTYRPFRNIPCFLHRPIEYFSKRIKKIPIIVEFQDQSYQQGINEVKNTNCRINHEFPSLCSFSTKVSINQLEDLLDNCHHIKMVYYDREVEALLDTATPAINSHQLHESGFTGKDVTIAIIDTGIHPHEDLAGRITGFHDFVNQRTVPYDDNGHGTHCAGDAAGSGSASGGRYLGPAPDANLVGVKVLNKKGSGSLSTVIAGLTGVLKIEIYTISISFPYR